MFGTRFFDKKKARWFYNELLFNSPATGERRLKVWTALTSFPEYYIGGYAMESNSPEVNHFVIHLMVYLLICLSYVMHILISEIEHVFLKRHTTHCENCRSKEKRKCWTEKTIRFFAFGFLTTLMAFTWFSAVKQLIS